MTASHTFSSASPGRTSASKPLLLLLLLVFAAFFSGADARALPGHGHHQPGQGHHLHLAPAPAPSWPPEWSRYKRFPSLTNFTFASKTGIIHNGNECFDSCIPACRKQFPEVFIDECPFFCLRTCNNLFGN